MEACGRSIEGAKGKLVVKEAARAVSERDDRLLAEKLEALENANKEVRGVLGWWLFWLKVVTAHKKAEQLCRAELMSERGACFGACL